MSDETDTATAEPYPRPPIRRGSGSTESERHLARLADRSFLDLWSYPNPYRDQKPGESSDGKEICDLLVVCGRHVLIFSEKNIQWSSDKPSSVAWPRWYKKAVRDAVKQLNGAQRWIDEFPSRIFVDSKCTTRIPVLIPPAGERFLHRIVVARGAGRHSVEHFGGGSGSFVVQPSIKDDDHWQVGCEPFAIGDVDSAGSYVHVFDDASLDVILSELDTISDFTDYLTRKEHFIRSGRLAMAHGEEDLLAYYAVRTTPDGEHDFTHPDDRPWRENESIAIDGTHYPSLIKNPQYAARKKADENSYIWDELIKQFTKHMLGGTSLRMDGLDYDISKSEIAVRYMALERRFHRRAHGEAILGAIAAARGKEIFLRSMIPLETSREHETGFFFLQISYTEKLKQLGRDHDDYRRARAKYAITYAEGLLLRFPYLRRIVGVAMPPPESDQIASEDIVFAERPDDWSDEAKQEVRTRCDALNIVRPDMALKHYIAQEYPDTDPIDREIYRMLRGANPSNLPRKNRAERRAIAARRKK